jgi:hypothetical protein
MLARRDQRLQMPLTREKHRFAGRLAVPAGNAFQLRAQDIDSGTGLGRQIDTVSPVDPGSRPVRSILLTTVINGTSARAIRSCTRASTSASAAGQVASTRCSTASARSSSASVRATPSRSTSSSVARRPAVSMIDSGIPSTSIACAIRSRVVPGHRGDDRDVFAGQGVEQTRLADVGRADQHDRQPAAQHRALSRLRQHVLQIGAQCARAGPRRRRVAGNRSLLPGSRASLRPASAARAARRSIACTRRENSPASERTALSAPRLRSKRRSGRRPPRPAPDRAARSRTHGA